MNPVKDNPNFGESREDFLYHCFRCCYCDRLAPTTFQQEDTINSVSKQIPIELTTWQKSITMGLIKNVIQKGSETDEEYNKKIEARLDKELSSMGTTLAYRQIIHRLCLSMAKY